MSYPTFSYHKGWQDDGSSLTPLYTWTEKGTGDGDVATMTVVDSEYFKIDLTAVLGDASVYWEYPDSVGADDIGIDSTIYQLVLYRYKCSNPNVKAKIEEVWSGGAVKTILPETNATTFTYGTIIIDGTVGQDVDHIRLYATNAIGNVYYDFVVLCEGTFTFPTADVELYLPQPTIANIGIPGRDGQILQNLGSELARVHITADMTPATTAEWGTPKGQRIYQICHHQSNDLWQWWEFPKHGVKFKACIESSPEISVTDTKMLLDLWLKEYKLGDACNSENYSERFGHPL